MKIVQILPELNAGGVERGTLEIAARLVRECHEAIVISNGGRLVEQLERGGARHVTMAVQRKNLSSLFKVRAMRRFLTDERADIVHIRSRVPGWITWLAWRGMNPATRPRLVSTVHGFYSINSYSAIMTRGERVIAVSNCIRDYILANYPKTPEEIIRVIPRGIEPEKYGTGFQPSNEWLKKWQAGHPGLAGKCVLLLPGRITRLKGHGDFFNLIAALKSEKVPVHGLVAGDTHPQKQEYMGELREMVSRLGIADELTFLGHRGDIREVMSVSNVVLALSQQPESFGRTVLEAMALGKPVVGYDCGGVGELLGGLFPEGRVALGNAAELLEVTREVIRGRNAPLPVGEPFTLDAMCRSTLEVYRELAEMR
jgi:glycosyltransferase involved in cell wall biosynthesis